MKQYIAGPMAIVLSLFGSAATAAPPALDVSTATTYLDTEVGTAQGEVAAVVFGLAAAAMGIAWVKAVFFS